MPDNKCCWALECWSKSGGWDFSRFKWFTICWWQFKLVSNFSLILIQPLNTIPAIFFHNLSFALYNLPVFFLFIFSMLSYKAVCCQILSKFVCAQKQLNVVPVPSTQMFLQLLIILECISAYKTLYSSSKRTIWELPCTAFFKVNKKLLSQ